MKNKSLFLFAAFAALASAQVAQTSDIVIKLIGKDKPIIAVPDLRGSGATQAFMNTFNGTLYSDLETAGIFQMSSKSVYPLTIPQRPQDFRQPAAGEPATGLWLNGWSDPPVNATYLTFGYAGESNSQFVLYGWLYNVKQPDLANEIGRASCRERV